MMGKQVHIVHVDGAVQMVADVSARQLVDIYRLGDRLRASAARLRAAMVRGEKRKG